MSTIPLHPNRRDKGQVEVMSGLGASEEYIAKHLGISVEDLKSYYSPELEHGKDEANLKVAQTFHDMATSGEHPQMTILWMKMRAKWSEAPSTETSPEDDDTAIEEAREKLSKLLNRGK